MPNESDSQWLEVIGKSLAYLCVQEVARNDAKRVSSVPDKVKFHEGLGIPMADAAEMLGTTANSVKTILRSKAKRTGGKNGKKAKR